MYIYLFLFIYFSRPSHLQVKSPGNEAENKIALAPDACLCFRKINSRYTRAAEFPIKTRHVYSQDDPLLIFCRENLPPSTFERFRSKSHQIFHVLSSLLVHCGRRRRANVLMEYLTDIKWVTS